MATTTDLERLVVQMSLDIRKFEQSLAKANGTTVRELSKIERRFQSAQKRISGTFAAFGRGFVGGIAGGGVALAGASIARILADAIPAAAAIGDLSDKIGISTDALQQLQFGAVQANISFKELETGLLRFARSTSEARSGQGELAKVLKANGVDLTNDLNQNLRLFANLLKNTTNESDRLRLVFLAFGRGGANFEELLRGGSKALDEMAAKATTMSEAFIRGAQRADDKWAEVLLRMSRNAGVAVGVILSQLSKIPGFFDAFQGFDDGTGRTRVNRRGAPLFVDPRDPELRRPAPGAGTREPETIIQTQEELEALRDLEREREQALRQLEREQEQFHRNLLSQQQRTEAIQLETEIMGLSTQAQETARAKMELMNAAIEANIVLTADVVREIDAAAEGFGAAAAAFEQAQERIELIADANGVLRDSLQGFFTDIAHGVKPIDALSDSLKRLGDRLLDLVLNQAFNTLFQTGAGQPAGGLLASLFHRGGVVGAGGSKRQVSPLAFIGAPRMHSGGMAGNEVPAILQRGEIVIPRSMAGRGGGTTVQIIDQRSASAPPVERQRGSDGVDRFILRDTIRGMLPAELNKIMPSQFGVTSRLNRRGT